MYNEAVVHDGEATRLEDVQAMKRRCDAFAVWHPREAHRLNRVRGQNHTERRRSSWSA